MATNNVAKQEKRVSECGRATRLADLALLGSCFSPTGPFCTQTRLPGPINPSEVFLRRKITTRRALRNRSATG